MSGDTSGRCSRTAIETSRGGAGGGGGGSNTSTIGGGGGGSGAFAQHTFNVTPGTVYDYTVGLGGKGGDPGYDGIAGGYSRFNGSTLFAAGGAFALNQGIMAAFLVGYTFDSVLNK